MLLKANESIIIVLGRSQLLKFYHNDIFRCYHISTSKNGFGETLNSFKTPRGFHYIRAIIGKDQPINTYYKSRRPTKPTENHITSRILWLCGLESHNHHPSRHSMNRYIYIHGVPTPFKKTPQSIGCINMRNEDVAELANLVPKYCKVLINPD